MILFKIQDSKIMDSRLSPNTRHNRLRIGDNLESTNP